MFAIPLATIKVDVAESSGDARVSESYVNDSGYHNAEYPSASMRAAVSAACGGVIGSRFSHVAIFPSRMRSSSPFVDDPTHEARHHGGMAPRLQHVAEATSDCQPTGVPTLNRRS